MCGRYALYTPPHKLKDLFGTDNIPNFPPRYNAAPMQDMPIIIHGRTGMARWGLTPPWADHDNTSLSAKLINARSETVARKPSFSESWHKNRKCLIPADGFYEWVKGEDGNKQPFFIFHKDKKPIAFAGLWSKKDEQVTFTILTKQADHEIAKLHSRMPVIFSAERSHEWFSADKDKASEMIDHACAKDMDYYCVGKDVGKVSNDSQELVLPLTSHQTAI